MAAPSLQDLPHLARRFFGFLRSQPLAPDEQAFVAGVLEPAEARLFWSQQTQDQRHAFDVAAVVSTRRPCDRELVKAALLHDVGKRHERLGPVARSLATLMDMARLPLPARFRRYRDHGRLGASELEAMGLDGIVVEFALRHPGPAPEGIDAARWDLLLEADDE